MRRMPMRRMHEVYVHEVHAYEMHAYEVHTHKAHTHKVYIHEIHAYEGFCEDLARQNAVAQLSQVQVRFRRRHIWVSDVTGVP